MPRILLLILALAITACTTVQPTLETDDEELETNENLHSVLWTQTAQEYDAVTLQSYRLGIYQLAEALEDPEWTASLEQRDDEGYQNLPPAVVLDVDETVLDNAAYQARLVEEGLQYDSDSWADWVREEAAVPVPGALEFIRAARDRGVEVIYLTNRDAELEEATRDNLQALGFPVGEEDDELLMRGEEPAWDTSNKTPRREYVAENYRILLLFGDNLGDFIGEVDLPVGERDDLFERYRSMWGTRWIAFPNPQYGSWEGALFDFDYGLSREEKLDEKYDQLDLD